MAWVHVADDDRYRIKFRIFRCYSCKRLAVSTDRDPPDSRCVCGAR